MYYANSQQLTEEITALVNNAEPPLRWLCIDASAVDDVYYSAAREPACHIRTIEAKRRAPGSGAGHGRCRGSES